MQYFLVKLKYKTAQLCCMYFTSNLKNETFIFTKNTKWKKQIF